MTTGNTSGGDVVAHVDASAQLVKIFYRNYRGQESWRTVRPIRIRFGSNEWHPHPQWLLDAIDVARGVERSFAVRDIARWTPQATGCGSVETPSGSVNLP
ncbi:hypothetical protein [Micromonospora sp. NPDC005979]|uniref:hypothetical protein n=1 Tax=Micromonospora sp. NPDC005979 TaxID=3156726 RepID=UPI0033A9E7CE